MGKLIIMIHYRLITTYPALLLKPVALFCMMTFLSILPTNAAPPQKNPTATAASTTGPTHELSAVINERPSRYISPEELQAYVQAVSLTFSMKTRATDPFGQQQNPDAKPVIKPTTTKLTRTKTLPSQITPFAEIVRRIRVTTVMPADRRFLVGDRSFKQGDRFPMNFRGRSIKVEIAAVSSQEIAFRNLDNGETASLKLTLMPPGMTPGNGKITAPGMVPENANSPLEIESASSPNDHSLN
jgi:hypothetical protein